MRKKEYMSFICIIICMFILFQYNGAVCSNRAGQFPPQLMFPAPDSGQEQEYLGLRAIGPFQISDIKAKLVVIEFMDALCPPCHANAPIMNDIYDTIQGDSRIADVKVIAIAVSNEKDEIEAYKKEFKIEFPILLVGDLAILAAMDGIQTPTTMIVSTENSKVLVSYTGVIQDSDGFVKQLKAFRERKHYPHDR